MLHTDACGQETLLSKQTNQNLCGDSGTLVLQWRASDMRSCHCPLCLCLHCSSFSSRWRSTCPRCPLGPSADPSDSCAHAQPHSPRKSELLGPLSSSQANSSRKCLFSPNCPNCCIRLNESFELGEAPFVGVCSRGRELGLGIACSVQS